MFSLITLKRRLLFVSLRETQNTQKHKERYVTWMERFDGENPEKWCPCCCFFVGQVRELLLKIIINCVNHFLKCTSICASCMKLRVHHAEDDRWQYITLVSVCKELSESFIKKEEKCTYSTNSDIFTTEPHLRSPTTGHCAIQHFISLQNMNCTHYIKHTHLNFAWPSIHPSLFVRSHERREDAVLLLQQDVRFIVF